MWFFGMFAAAFSVLGLWGGFSAAIWTLKQPNPSLWLILWPVVFLVCQWLHAFLRQRTIGILLERDKAEMRPAARADLCLFWLFSLILLAILITSAFGNTLAWRGIRYRLHGPTRIEIIR